MTARLVVTAALLLLLLFDESSAFTPTYSTNDEGYSGFGVRATSELVFGVNFEEVGTSRRLDLETGLKTWDRGNIPGCSIHTTFQNSTASPLNTSDNHNTFSFGPLGAGTTAESRSRWDYSQSPPILRETDIIFSTFINWAPVYSLADSTPDANGLYANINLGHSVAHEVGHAIGLRHENSRLSVLQAYPYGGKWNCGRLHGDDRNAARTLYPDIGVPAEMDLQVGGWAKDHFDSIGIVANPPYSPTAINDTTFAVGATVWLDYTQQNLGTHTPVSFDVEAILSTDTAIGNLDDLIIATDPFFLPDPAIGGNVRLTDRSKALVFEMPCVPAGAYYMCIRVTTPNDAFLGNNVYFFGALNRRQQFVIVQPPGGCTGAPQPGQARQVVASDGTHCKVQVTWLPPTSGGVSVWGVYRDGNFMGTDPEVQGQPIAYSWFDDYAVPGQTYSYTVRSFDLSTNLPNGPVSEPNTGFAKTNTLPSPQQLTASQNRTDGVLLTWQWPSGVPNPGMFRVLREPFYLGDPIHQLADTARSFLAPGVLGANTYRVQSYNSSSDLCLSTSTVEGYVWSASLSSITASVSAPQCAAPTVTWSYSGAVSNLQGYRIYRDNVLVHTATTSPPPSWVDVTATAASHTYWVDAYNPVATGRSNAVNVSVTRAPVGFASGLAVSSSNQSGSCREKLTVSWSWGNEFVNGWLIYRDGSATPLDTVNNAGGASLAFTDYDVAPGSFHTYQISGYSSLCGPGGQSPPESGMLGWEPAQWIPNGVPVSDAAGAQSRVRAIAERRFQRLYKETGAAYVAWEDRRSGDSDIYVQKISEGGNSCWAADGVPVCTAPGDQTEVKLGLDVWGGIFVIWEDRRGGASDIYAQRVDEFGVPTWATNGVAVCTASGDQISPEISGTPGLMVAWEDKRTGTSDIYGQMLDLNGVEDAYPNGFPICTASGPQTDVAVASGPSGSSLIAWTDTRPSSDSNIYMQRMFYDGAPAWATNGIPVCDAPGIQDSPVLVTWPYFPGGNVKAAGITWSDQRRGPELYDVYSQRIDVDQPQNGYLVRWGLNGVAVSVGASVLAPARAAAAADPSGHLIVAWEGRPQGADLNIYAQRLDEGGGPLLMANGKPLCTAAGEQWGTVVSTDGTGGAVVAWMDRRNGTDLDVFARRIAPNGDLFGGINGSAVASMAGDQGSPAEASLAIAAGVNGGAIVTWPDSRPGATSDVFANRAAPHGMSDLDLAQSYYVPEAGSVSNPQQGIQAYRLFRTCPNNDTGSLPNHARIKIVLKDASGAPLVGIPESEISILFNGGTTQQGFSGPGADSIIANSMWNPAKQCPDVRHIRADAPTNGQGATYITFRGSTPGSPGVATKDPLRKWGHYDSDIPVFALGQQLSGRLTDGSANGSYQLQIRNADYTGGLGAVLNQGEAVTNADFSGVANNLSTPWNPIFYWRDFDADGQLGPIDFQFISAHTGHDCSLPEDD